MANKPGGMSLCKPRYVVEVPDSLEPVNGRILPAVLETGIDENGLVHTIRILDPGMVDEDAIPETAFLRLAILALLRVNQATSKRVDRLDKALKEAEVA
jgi:hypothetical protein